MHVRDLLSEYDLNIMLLEGYVHAQFHPSLPLTIYNYTKKGQFEHYWNATTKICRGLIVDNNGEVIARPFPKFFNYGDILAPRIDLTDPVSAYDKMDGSLGIMYAWNGLGPTIATRGSFTSEQATRATDILIGKYQDFRPPDGYTLLFEIVYPENRIVCDYGDEEDLWLLGMVEISTGHVFPAASAQAVSCWNGPAAQHLGAKIDTRFSDILLLPERDGAEGMVVYSGNKMLKIKQADYVELHKTISGLNEKAVWQWLADGKPLDELVMSLPDEFQGWTQKTAENLYDTARAILDEADHDFGRIWRPDMSRKDFAFQAMRTKYSGVLFRMLDGKGYWPQIWDMIKPRGDTKIFSRSEDVA